ncbi:hypothetical protein ZWY2020_017602 [Hordeum vulgare]|nr:hypothetical protein ZWY2020_017602 [Hordeum vulgare]
MVLAKAAVVSGLAPPLGGSRGAAAEGHGATVRCCGNLPPVSSKAEKFPARPGFGTIGRRCRVRANHCRKIKRLCETELGVITQCCLPKNVQKGGKQYLEKSFFEDQCEGMNKLLAARQSGPENAEMNVVL